MNLLPVFITVFSIFLRYHIFGPQSTSRVTFERIQQISGADVANFTNLRLIGGNDAMPFLNGSWELFQDLDNNWSQFVRLWYQSPVATDATFYPIQTPNRSIRVCDHLNSEHYRAWWNRNRYAVNYPEPQQGRWMCPFPKGEYYLRWVALEKGVLPWVSKPGLYRMDFCLANNGVVRMIHALYFRVQPVIGQFQHNRK
ncbi:AAEL012066-PA [Aedes aegypti]|uniref:AAEL012066-PA n=1 Tax=Aedes aegypti TaxID=7159 RepID=Q16N78_AEDAE|nr:AAEL012066-PA [Aedes aegypti]